MKQLISFLFIALFIFAGCGDVELQSPSNEMEEINHDQTIEVFNEGPVPVYDWRDFVAAGITLKQLAESGRHDQHRASTLTIGEVKIQGELIPFDIYDDSNDVVEYVLRSDVQQIGLLITLGNSNSNESGPILLPEYNQIVFGQDGREYARMLFGHPAIIKGYPLPKEVSSDDFVRVQRMPAFIFSQQMLTETSTLQFSTNEECDLLTITTDNQVYEPAVYGGSDVGFLSQEEGDYYFPLEDLRGFEAPIYRFDCDRQVIEMIWFDRLTTNFIEFGPNERAFIFYPY